jgi:hypothetical protein
MPPSISANRLSKLQSLDKIASKTEAMSAGSVAPADEPDELGLLLRNPRCPAAGSAEGWERECSMTSVEGLNTPKSLDMLLSLSLVPLAESITNLRFAAVLVSSMESPVVSPTNSPVIADLTRCSVFAILDETFVMPASMRSPSK